MGRQDWREKHDLVPARRTEMELYEPRDADDCVMGTMVGTQPQLATAPFRPPAHSAEYGGPIGVG